MRVEGTPRPKTSGAPPLPGTLIVVSAIHNQDWVEKQLADPQFRRAYLQEVIQMQHEAIETGDPVLARWCMRLRARLDSIDSTG